MDEMLAIDNIDVLRRNGFEVDTPDENWESGQGRHRLQLVAQPVSKGTTFDMKGASRPSVSCLS